MLQRAARKGNSRAGTIAGKNATSPDVRDATRAAPDVGDSRGDIILCIKQKAAQIRYPASFVLTFRAYFKRVAHLERPYRGFANPTAVLYDVHDARAILLLLFTCVRVCKGAARRMRARIACYES